MAMGSNWPPIQWAPNAFYLGKRC